MFLTYKFWFFLKMALCCKWEKTNFGFINFIFNFQMGVLKSLIFYLIKPIILTILPLVTFSKNVGKISGQKKNGFAYFLKYQIIKVPKQDSGDARVKGDNSQLQKFWRLWTPGTNKQATDRGTNKRWNWCPWFRRENKCWGDKNCVRVCVWNYDTHSWDSRSLYYTRYTL